MSLVRLMSCGFLNILRRFGNHGITSPLAQKQSQGMFIFTRIACIGKKSHSTKINKWGVRTIPTLKRVGSLQNVTPYALSCLSALLVFLGLEVIFQAVPSSVLQVTASQDWDKLERQRRWPGTEGDRRRMARVRPPTGAHRMPASSALLHLSSMVPQIQLPDQFRHCFCSSFTSFGRSLFFSFFFFLLVKRSLVSFGISAQ